MELHDDDQRGPTQERDSSKSPGQTERDVRNDPKSAPGRARPLGDPSRQRDDLSSRERDEERDTRGTPPSKNPSPSRTGGSSTGSSGSPDRSSGSSSSGSGSCDDS